MPKVCFYFQLHQPYRLRDYEVFEVGSRSSRYFSRPKSNSNREIFRKVAKKSYIPMLSLLQKLIKQYPDFNFSLSASGVFLEQAKLYGPEVIILLKNLAATGRVEFLAETYYHSLSALYSPAEFKKQVAKHQRLIKKLFNQRPIVFRNTELIYSNQIGKQVADLGFVGILTEAVDRYMGDRSKTQVFQSYNENPMPMMLKHAQLSDDIAFRFSDRNWHWFPLTTDRYLDWLSIYSEDQLINLFMDFETFGEHQWEDSGIFEFFESFVERFLKNKWNKFVLPGEVLTKASQNIKHLPVYDVPEPISWADVDRDLTAWIDSPLQQDTLRQLYGLEEIILKKQDKKLLEDWRRLQTSDHFYYMCTKWSADGDVHAYFSPYDSPFEAYRQYSIVLADVKERLLD